MLSNRTAWLLFSALAVVLSVLLLWPVFTVVSGGFLVDGRLTAQVLLGVFRNPIYAEGLFNSLCLAFGATALSAVFAVPLACLSHAFALPAKRLLNALLLVPMVLPPFVGAIGFVQIFGPYGALNALFGCGPVDWLGRSRAAGVILLQALAFYPILYLNVSAALANVDPALHEAARNLGARSGQVFRRITLPLVMPGLFAGGILVFIASFTDLGTPLILSYSRCAAVQVYDELKEISASPFPYALVTVLLCASIALYALSRLLFGGRAFALQAKATSAHTPRPLRGLQAGLALLPFLAVAALALLPHAGVLLTSLSAPGAWYQTVLPDRLTLANFGDALGHPMTLHAIRNSLLYSCLAVLLNLAIGLAIAWVVVRSTLRARGLLDALAMVPLAVPGLVMAFGFVAVSGTLAGLPLVKSSPALLALLDVQTNPTFFLTAAYAVRRLPYVVRAAVAGLQQTSVTLEEAGASLGAPPWVTLRRITVPLIAANLIAGLLLAFAFSMLEVSDSLMLAQKTEHYPITKTIFELTQLMGVGRHLACALGVWAMLFLATMLAGCSLLLGKRLGALFRA